MHVPIEIIAILIAAWVSLQLAILIRLGKLETQQAVSKEKIYNQERLLNDILNRYFHNRDTASQIKRNIDPDSGFQSDDDDPGNV